MRCKSLTMLPLFLVACGPDKPRQQPDPPPAPPLFKTSIGNLSVNAELYVGCRVSVHLAAGSYTVNGGTVAVHAPFPRLHLNLIVFAFPAPVKATGDVVIVGTVTAVVPDGQYRQAGVRWEVRVGDCRLADPEP